MEARINKWGNSLGVRLPTSVVRELRLSEGTTLDLRVQDGTVILEPTKPKQKLYDLREIVAQMDPATYPDEDFESWPVGKELI